MEHLNHFLSCGAYNHTSIRFHWSLNKICGLWLKPFTNLTFSGAGKSLHGHIGSDQYTQQTSQDTVYGNSAKPTHHFGMYKFISRTPWMMGKHRGFHWDLTAVFPLARLVEVFLGSSDCHTKLSSIARRVSSATQQNSGNPTWWKKHWSWWCRKPMV